jgi:hypothetical protein
MARRLVARSLLLSHAERNGSHMTKALPPHPGWTDADTEAMFAEIGRYVVFFQWIEGKLDQILLLGWGHENWTASQAKLSRMSNSAKIEEVQSLVLNSPDFARVHSRPDWCMHFNRVVKRLHDERHRRNRLVHSQYLFEFTEIGLPPMRSHRDKAAGEELFNREDFTKEAQEAMLGELLTLALDVNFVHVQLVHDYKAVVPQS